MNANTVIRAYRELENEGVIELRHGSGAFICDSVVARTRLMHKAQAVMQAALDRLVSAGVTEDEMRRLFENEVAQLRATRQMGARRG